MGTTHGGLSPYVEEVQVVGKALVFHADMLIENLHLTAIDPEQMSVRVTRRARIARPGRM